MRRQVLGTLVAAVLLAGCGSERAVTTSASEVLTADVARLKAAATSGTSAEVARAADRLRTDVGTQRTSGDLSAERAAAILDQLARVLADTAARPLPTPSPKPVSTGDSDRHEGDGDKGRGKGKD